MATIAFIEPTPVTLPYLQAAARSLGCECLVICGRGHYTAESERYLDALQAIEADSASTDRLAAAIHREASTGLAGITSTADRFLRSACLLAAQFGVPGPDATLLEMSDKGSAYQASPDSFPPTVLFDGRDPPIRLLTDKVREEGAFVCKPCRAAGGDGIVLVSTPEEVARLPEQLDPRFIEQRWIAQCAVQGTLLSLEGYVISGAVRILGLSVRSRYGFSEVTNEFPRAGTAVGKEVEPAVGAIQRRFLQATGFRNGYFHSEYLLDSRGRAFLIDPNLGRIGGGGIFHQIVTSFSLTPEVVLAHVLDVTLFGQSHLDGERLYQSPCRPSYFVQYGLREAARLVELRLPAPVTGAFHTTIARPGAQLPAHGRNNRSQIGIVSGDPAQVKRFVEAIEIVTDTGTQRPFYGV